MTRPKHAGPAWGGKGIKTPKIKAGAGAAVPKPHRANGVFTVRRFRPGTQARREMWALSTRRTEPLIRKTAVKRAMRKTLEESSGVRFQGFRIRRASVYAMRFLMDQLLHQVTTKATEIRLASVPPSKRGLVGRMTEPQLWVAYKSVLESMGGDFLVNYRKEHPGDWVHFEGAGGYLDYGTMHRKAHKTLQKKE